ncbi:MAG: DUF3365 domain-containing protein [Gammaproteobacteria bacterium]|nr:DUF3365 domain-containing protein [Gammaproteobacteria bacterium]MXW46924.1 DUF3365 domain-containing protein [Gammaproteobacteria bacterium]MYD02815.1 DUF3365 domain-containing protein [Gammaproteobacteria bacterium]MYI24392.1 DUF3365 domain-containing protein [Gammaproteobacteria bacterium]
MQPRTLMIAAGLAVAAVTAIGAAAQGLPYPKVADMLYRVMSADREVYTRMVVQRLTLEDKVLTASEHFEDEAALPLPAQMFRFGAETVMNNTEEFSYALLSLNPINRTNGPGTELEREGLEFVTENPDENFYGEEELGGKRYFAAVYPDRAIVEACVNCHNNHRDSSRTDLKAGDVMGGVVIRIRID